MQQLRLVVDNDPPPFRHRWKGELMRCVYDHGHEHLAGFDWYLHRNYGIVKRVIEWVAAMVAAGREYNGIRAFLEDRRFNSPDREVGGGTYKLNNNWMADIAMVITHAYPQFAGFFELRHRRSKRLGCYEPEL